MSLHQNYVDLEKGKQAAISTAQLLKQSLLWNGATNNAEYSKEVREIEELYKNAYDAMEALQNKINKNIALTIK